MEAAVVFLPLLGAAIAGLFGRAIGTKGAQFVTCSGLVIAALISWYLFFTVAIAGDQRTVLLFQWVSSGSLSFDW